MEIDDLLLVFLTLTEACRTTTSVLYATKGIFRRRTFQVCNSWEQKTQVHLNYNQNFRQAANCTVEIYRR